ncbi:hypothetical protein Ancab_016489 [Ancistrocladus abbreviatus]
MPLNLLGLGAGGGCGIGLGLGWGFGAAFGSKYRSSKVTFEGIDFDSRKHADVKESAESRHPREDGFDPENSRSLPSVITFSICRLCSDLPSFNPKKSVVRLVQFVDSYSHLAAAECSNSDTSGWLEASDTEVDVDDPKEPKPSPRRLDCERQIIKSSIRALPSCWAGEEGRGSHELPGHLTVKADQTNVHPTAYLSSSSRC